MQAFVYRCLDMPPLVYSCSGLQVFSNLAGIMLSDGVCNNLRHAACCV